MESVFLLVCTLELFRELLLVVDFWFGKLPISSSSSVELGALGFDFLTILLSELVDLSLRLYMVYIY